jgi:hypothetical protein
VGGGDGTDAEPRDALVGRSLAAAVGTETADGVVRLVRDLCELVCPPAPPPAAPTPRSLKLGPRGTHQGVDTCACIISRCALAPKVA